MRLQTIAKHKTLKGEFTSIKHNMKLLTTQEAAEKLGVTSTRIRAMILSGRLPAEKFGHVHMIKEEDLALVADRKPGRPPKSEEEKLQAIGATPPPAAVLKPKARAGKKSRKSSKKGGAAK